MLLSKKVRAWQLKHELEKGIRPLDLCIVKVKDDDRPLGALLCKSEAGLIVVVNAENAFNVALVGQRCSIEKVLGFDSCKVLVAQLMSNFSAVSQTLPVAFVSDLKVSDTYAGQGI